MRKLSKVLALVLIVMTLVMGLSAITASAAKTTGDTVLYLTPNANWKSEGARFAVYTWDVSPNWYDMTDENGDGIYECTIPAGVENIIFCRMNPNTTANNWNNKYNQTGDLKYDGTNNHYTVNEGQWDSGSNGVWSLLEIGECIHAPSGEGTVVTPATCTENGEVSHTCSKCGETYTATILATGHTYAGKNAVCECGAQAVFTVAGDNTALFGTAWDPAIEDNKLTYDEATGLWSISYTNSGSASIWPNFKVCLDKGWNTCWGAAAAGQTGDNAWVEVPAGYVLTITLNYETNALSMETEAPHVHSWSDATCTEAQKCECGETQGEALGHKDTGLDAKCDMCGEYFVPTSPFKLEIYQHSKKATYYFKGSMNGYYFATTSANSLTGAVDVYAEETDGGYYLYFMSGETKNYLYIQISGSYTNIKYGSTKAVWAFNTTFGTFTTVVNGTTYYMGTYGTYSTISASKISYLSATNMDVSQFPARPVSLVDHVCSDFTSKVTNPTCTAQGYTTKTCTACGVATKVDYVDALGHDLVDVEALAPTCTAAGYTAHKDCSRCTYVEGKETVAALGHDIIADAAVDATCTETGLTAGEHCSRCDHKVAQEEVAALGHDMIADAAVDATCTETGLTAGEHCSRCDHKVAQEEVPALGHDLTVLDAVAPTCTETGLTAGESCSRCDHKVEQTVVDALGHDMIADAAVDATCTETGLTAGEHCSRCDHKVAQEEVPALGHSFAEGTCSVCGAADPDYVAPEEPVDPETPEDPEDKPAEPQPEPTLWERIIAFFHRVINKLKRIFRIG